MVAEELESTRAQIQKMCASRTFETSETQRRLLQYLAEKALSGEADRLKEYTVGIEAFHKPSSYDPQHDSIVRTQTGRLRAKLLEYYGAEGRDDPIMVELPKGGFKLTFRPQAPELRESSKPVVLETAGVSPWMWVSVALAAGCIAVGVWGFSVRNRGVEAQTQTPWPLARVITANQPTALIVSDSSLTMLRFFNGRPRSIEDYLSKDFRDRMLAQAETQRESKVLGVLSNASLTGFASLQNVKAVIHLAGPLARQITLRSPKDVRPRDLRDGNSILVGSSVSNPWVSMFEHYMNFREVDETLERGEKYFLNKKPLPGEDARYKGMPWGSNSGTAYASIVLVPNEQQTGSVLILQGLQAQGTEAAGLFLSSDQSREKLRERLRASGADPDKTSFEVLIRARAVAAAPSAVEIVALRVIR
jgi:hypothetical protein